jgi:hypothetical protein
MKNPGSLYPVGGDMPTARIHHSSVACGNHIIIFGGYGQDGNFLDDVNIFDQRAMTWTGPIMRRECCNEHGSVIDSMGLKTEKDFAYVKVGFEGDIPAPRAEHGACAVAGAMYVFGGITSKYSYTRDFYKFDPITLTWTLLEYYKSSSPPRRAGHALVGYGDSSVYVFGGRGVMAGKLRGYNDVWKYDLSTSTWSLASASAGDGPAGRQHTAAAVINDKMYIYGGVDPLTNSTFNDLWAFNLGLQTWQKLQPQSGHAWGHAPPPLFNAHMIPVASSSSSGDGLLIYGGISGGGSCSIAVDCLPQGVSIGQLYRINIGDGGYSAGRMRSATRDLELSFVHEVSWNYSRITGLGGDSRHLMITKKFALESVAYDPDRNRLYEFGGLVTISDTLTSDNQPINYNLPNDPPRLDAGGVLPQVTSDKINGEPISSYAEKLPTTETWQYRDGFSSYKQPLVDSSTLRFLRSFRVYTLTPTDLVLVHMDDETQV